MSTAYFAEIDVAFACPSAASFKIDTVCERESDEGGVALAVTTALPHYDFEVTPRRLVFQWVKQRTVTMDNRWLVKDVDVATDDAAKGRLEQSQKDFPDAKLVACRTPN